MAIFHSLVTNKPATYFLNFSISEFNDNRFFAYDESYSKCEIIVIGNKPVVGLFFTRSSIEIGKFLE